MARSVLRARLGFRDTPDPPGRRVLEARQDRRGAGAGASFRVVSDSAQASCGAGEIMASAYCAGGAAIHIDGTTGASCDGGAKTVIVCAKQ